LVGVSEVVAMKLWRVLAGLLVALYASAASAGTVQVATQGAALQACQDSYTYLAGLGTPGTASDHTLYNVCQGPLNPSTANPYNGSLTPATYKSYILVDGAPGPGSTIYYWTFVTGCTAPMVFDPATHSCINPIDCSADKDFETNFAFADGGLHCGPDQCVYVCASGDEGVIGSSCGRTHGTCPAPATPPDQWPCPVGYVALFAAQSLAEKECVPSENDSDDDGKPNSSDPNPNENDNTPDQDNDNQPDDEDINPDDPTNGEDTGPGDESDNVSVGGGNCQTPPQSTGDGIAAMVAYQTWATRCQVEAMRKDIKDGVTISGTVQTQGTITGTVTTTGGGSGSGDAAGTSVTGGTSCVTPYVCASGDVIACKALQEEFKTRCNSDAAEARIADVIAHGAEGGDGTEADLGDAEVEGTDLGEFVLDDGGWLGSNRSCPQTSIPGFSSIDAQRFVCDPMAIVASMMLFAMAVHGAIILGRAASGT
jgi:hypothetical protein